MIHKTTPTSEYIALYQCIFRKQDTKAALKNPAFHSTFAQRGDVRSLFEEMATFPKKPRRPLFFRIRSEQKKQGWMTKNAEWEKKRMELRINAMKALGIKR